MVKNLTRKDQIMRFSVAAVVIVLSFLLHRWWIALFALPPLVTGLMKSCPISVHKFFAKKTNPES